MRSARSTDSASKGLIKARRAAGCHCGNSKSVRSWIVSTVRARRYPERNMKYGLDGAGGFFPGEQSGAGEAALGVRPGEACRR